MKLPNASHAMVAVEKITDYLLNSDHPRGKHKARQFETTCGITLEHADLLRNQLLEAAQQGEATPRRMDEHGQRFMIEWRVNGPTGQALAITAWMIRTGENFPRFVSAYIR